MLKRISVYIFIFNISYVFAQHNAKSSPLQFIQIKNILENQWISNITQDREGFIWAATQDGLYKYNGKKFEVYRYNPLEKNSLPGSWVKVIKQDHDGVFWVGTYGAGLVKFNEKNRSFEKVKINSENSNSNPLVIYDIFISTASAIWVVTDDGLYRKSKSKSHFVKLKESVNSIKIIELENGTELVSHSNTLFNYNVNEARLEPLLSNIAIDEIKSVGTNKVIFKSKNELYYYDFTNRPEKIGLPNEDTILFMSNIKEETCIIVGETGSYLLNIPTKTFQPCDYSLEKFKSLGITNLFIDKQNLLWVATHKGLFKENVLNKVFQSNFRVNARRIFVDSDNLFAVGYQGFFKVSKSDRSNYQQFLNGIDLTAMCKTENGFWLGDTTGNLYFIDKDYKIKTIKLQKKRKGSLRVFGIVQDLNGFLWVSTWEGIYVLDDKGKTINIYKLDENKEIKIIKLIIDNQDNLWAITTGEGLYKISNISKVDKTQNHINYKIYHHNKTNFNSINSNAVMDIHASPNGTIWVGSDFGLNFYDESKDHFYPLKINGKTFDKKIMGIETDTNNLLWISTINNGIYVYNKENETLFNLKEEDGLISNACLYTSSAIYKDELYFGTDEGVQVINTSKFAYPSVTIVPDFHKMSTQGDSATFFYDLDSLQKPITLNYNQNSFSINLEISDYRFPEKIDYYYKLGNATNFWTKAESDIINFNKLNYGEYNLLVKAAYQATDNSPINVLALKIKPPWHKSILAYTLFFIGLAVAIFSFFKLRYKQKLAFNKLKAVEELDLIKSNLFTNISHELRTPLTLISGPIEHQLSKDNLKIDDREELNLVKQNADRLLNLVNQLMDLALIDSGQLKLKIHQGNLNVLLKQTIDAFKYQSQKKNIKIQAQIDKLESVWFDRDSLEKIVVNLLSNAVKYALPNSLITFQANQINNNLVLSVVNTCNKTNKNVVQLFQRFYQYDTSTEGVGVGLALVKELVMLNKGTILANKPEDDKIQFAVTLPIQKPLHTNLKPAHIEVLNNPKEYFDELNSQDDTVILIVEDEEDIRNFIAKILKNQYKIIVANNGEMAVKMALEHIPDLIISDIMMPVMDGITLCNTLKKDQLTSHIPIVLLTAKTGEAHEIEGLKTGADAYITKPFNVEKLKTRVEKLLEGRVVLQKYYSKDFSVSTDIKTTSSENEFLKRLQETLTTHLTNPQFSSERFATNMQMSRTQLHRKLKAIVNMTATEIIRVERLKLATQILKESDATVNEVAYQVGFNTPSYFIKCFKEIYNCTPNDYLQQ